MACFRVPSPSPDCSEKREYRPTAWPDCNALDPMLDIRMQMFMAYSGRSIGIGHQVAAYRIDQGRTRRMFGLGSSTGSSGLGSIFSTRYKRIDVNEFQQLATSYLEQSGASTSGSNAASRQATAGAALANDPSATLDAFMNGPLVDFSAGAEQLQYNDADLLAAQQADDQVSAQRAADARASAATAAPVTEVRRETTATAATPVSVPSTSIAPRTANDYWTSHIAQFRGAYLNDGPSMRPNCGPASVTMALRMIGLDIPGFNGQRSEAVLDKARVLATGQNNTSVGTTDSELERLISASGGRWSESQNFNEITGWVKQGIPVVLSGNPSRGWNNRYSADQVYPFDGGHWVTVSGYDQKTGYYIVNDPLSQIGPIYVSEQELHNYNASHGQLGIAVFR